MLTSGSRGLERALTALCYTLGGVSNE